MYTNCLGNLVRTNDNSVYSTYCFTRKQDGKSAPDGKTTPGDRTSVLKQEQESRHLRRVDARTGPAAPGRPAQWAIKCGELGPDQPLATVAAPRPREEDLDDADIDPMLAGNPEDDIS